MTDHNGVETRTDSNGAGSPSSQQVSWWPVHEFLEAVVNQANYGPLPTAGTPAWQALADGDPRKLLALAVSGEHWALRTEIAQERLAEAGRDISAAANWTSIANNIRRHEDAVRSGAYIPRRRSA
ncbi:DUF2742 domain-containing protein [Mycolicibacterium mageritense]|uniref:DUF2742 domain-containing protein n=1 Tax=Mycolicibacterium mageritense TaxID=53462 RepID=UPI0011DA246F|nr:DUF2742 domain-containing protein [Mycolicibacterium mageritense]TXI56244.1 MAG: DUF2742 domain-containing protein [Mycolicibacterium mageritense]